MKPVLHSAESSLTWRHGFSFVLLAFSAGAINAGAFVFASRFVSHVTGTVTSLGTNKDSWTAVFESAFLIVTFILGAVASVVALQARMMRGERPLHLRPLVIVAALVAVVAVLGRVAKNDLGELVLLGLLSFAMGLMNASVASSTEVVARTTHMTGPASDLGVELGVAFFATGEQRKRALRMAALRGGKLVGFILGALVMVPLAMKFGSIALLAPASLILFAGQRSFSPAPQPFVGLPSPRPSPPRGEGGRVMQR